MGTEKRARQKANRAARKAEVQEEETKEQREETTKKFGKWIAIAVAIIVVFFLFNILGGGDDDDRATATFVPTPEPGAEEVEVVEEVVLDDSIPENFIAFAGEGTLATVEPAARNDAYDAAPPMTIDPARTYAAIFDTTIGQIRFSLFVDEAPMAVNNFVNLAQDGFYDGLVFHRVVSETQVFGGDPLANDTGGPGYTFDDEISATAIFDRPGLLAMSNDGPNTNGSRFFITLQENEGLNGDHTIFGELVGSLERVEQIPDPSSGLEVGIDSVRILEG